MVLGSRLRHFGVWGFSGLTPKALTDISCSRWQLYGLLCGLELGAGGLQNGVVWLSDRY